MIKDSILIKSADYMKLAVTADMLENRVRIQNDLGKKIKKFCENWAKVQEKARTTAKYQKRKTAHR